MILKGREIFYNIVYEINKQKFNAQKSQAITTKKVVILIKTLHNKSWPNSYTKCQ